MNNIIREGANEAKDILGRIKKRDLEGNSRQAIKNSSWQIATNLDTKAGALLFTVIISRFAYLRGLITFRKRGIK